MLITAMSALGIAAGASPQVLAVSPATGAGTHRPSKAARRHARCTSSASHKSRGARTSRSVAAAHAHKCAATVHPKRHGTPTSRGHAPSASSAGTPTPAELIAAVLATTCQNTETVPTAANVAQAQEAVLCLINHVRAEHDEAPLNPNPELERAAREHAAELVADDYFAHVSPSGETPVERIRDTGYIPGPSFGYVIGENLAWGTIGLATPSSIVNAWVASPGHLANILEGRYRDTGVGITPAVPPSLGEGEPGATYAQEFGVLIE
jgi:uncharacterized protein YkwD